MPKGVAGLISDGMELCGYETVPERVVDLVTAAPGAGVATMTPELILECLIRKVHFPELNTKYIYIYIYLRRGGRKPAAARRVSLFLAGVAAQDTWSAACEAAVPRMRGAYVMVIEGVKKQARRLRDKFGMKEVVKEKCDTLYVGVGRHH